MYLIGTVFTVTIILLVLNWKNQTDITTTNYKERTVNENPEPAKINQVTKPERKDISAKEMILKPGDKITNRNEERILNPESMKRFSDQYDKPIYMEIIMVRSINYFSNTSEKVIYGKIRKDTLLNKSSPVPMPNFFW